MTKATETSPLSFRLLVDDEVGDVLRVTEHTRKGEKKCSYYSIGRHPERLDVFSLRKLVHSDELPEAYTVDLRAGSCTCPWGSYLEGRPALKKNGDPQPVCRHLQGMKALVEAGEF